MDLTEKLLNILINGSSTSSFQVPNGKRLYINTITGSLDVDGNIIFGNVYGNYGDRPLSNPIIVDENQTISSPNNFCTFHGFLVDLSTDLQSITVDASTYTVPSSKKLIINYVRRGTGSFGFASSSIELSQETHMPIIVDEGTQIYNSNGSFNGYLVDENYFAGCGGGGSTNNSNPNSTNISVSTFGDTLTINGQDIIVPGISYQNTPSNIFGSVTDIDGNVYQTVTINGKEWMMEDLRVTKFNNGDPIIQLTSNNGWTSSICNNPNYYEYNNVVYYNLLTINDSRNVCPTGWSVLHK